MTAQPTNQQLDEIEAKVAYLRGRLDRKNPWPSDKESHWTTEGWKAGTRNALDKLRVEELVAEVRRLRARRLTASEYDTAWHAVEGAAGEEGADPGTILHAVLDRLGIDWQDAARPAVPAVETGR